MTQLATLLIDAGNSRIKFGLTSTADEFKFLGSCDTHTPAPDVAAWLAAQNAQWQAARGVCVAGQAVTDALDLALAHWHHRIHWLTGNTPLAGLRNDYATPATLGADRWLAAYGLMHAQASPQVSHTPAVLATFGTATTVDALRWDDTAQCHAFAGGIIIAGLATALRSVSHSTARLPDVSSAAPPSFATLQIPSSTADALTIGAAYAQVGAVNTLVQHVTQQHGAPQLWLAGGAMAAVQGFFPMARVLHHPVLAGLARAGIK